MFQCVPRRYGSHRETADGTMPARSLQACGIRAFGVGAVAAFDNGDKIVYEFLGQGFAIRVGIGIVRSRLPVVVARRHYDGRSHVPVLGHVVEQFA